MTMDIELLAQDDYRFGNYNGIYVNALFYKLIREANPELSAYIHEKDEMKPFNISCVFKDKINRASDTIERGGTYSIRISILNHDKLFMTINEILQRYINKKMNFTVSGVDFQPVHIILKNCETVDDIAKNGDKPIKNFEIYFNSPTAFRMKGINYLFPDPSKVVKSLGEKWNAFSGTEHEIDEEVMLQISEKIYAVSHDIKTRICTMKGYKLVGFVGKCAYEAKDIPLELNEKLKCLLRLAKYSGIGYKTTMGMGQAAVKIIK